MCRLAETRRKFEDNGTEELEDAVEVECSECAVPDKAASYALKLFLLELFDHMEELHRQKLFELAKVFNELATDIVKSLVFLFFRTRQFLTVDAPSLFYSILQAADEFFKTIDQSIVRIVYEPEKATTALSTKIVSMLLKRLEEKNAEDVSDAIARCVASKLRMLPDEQRITAEKAILRVFDDVELKSSVQFL